MSDHGSRVEEQLYDVIPVRIAVFRSEAVIGLGSSDSRYWS